MLATRIRDALGREIPTARELVLRFEVDFAIPSQEDVGIAALRILDAEASEDPVVSVGVAWCQMVTADVRYHLATGRTAVVSSRVRAVRLAASAGKAEEAYVAARWLDASGRLAFRVGDYTQARVAFERAGQLAAMHGADWVVPDLDSNRIRAMAEEAAQPLPRRSEAERAVRGRELAAYDEALRRHAAAAHVPGAEPSARTREHLRGICSLHHNRANALEALGELEQALHASLASSRIAEELGDGYRLAQALLAQVRLATRGVLPGTGEDDRDTVALRLLDRVRELPWPRGHRMAEQQIARILSRQAHHHDAVGVATTLLQRIKDDAELRPQDSALDVDLRVYTVDCLAEVARAARTGDPACPTPDEKELLRERVDAVRLTRSVISRSLHKIQFARLAFPTFRACWAQEGDTEARLTLVEEASARELLDLSASRRGLARLPTLPALRLAPVATATGRERRNAPARRAAIGQAEEALLSRRTAYEDAMAHHPIPTVPVDAEVVYQTRLLTAGRPELTVVRFYELSDGPQAKVGFSVFSAGTVRTGECPDSALELARKLMARWNREQAPSPALAVAIHGALIAGVEQLAPGCIGTSRTLVLVPTAEFRDWPIHVSHRDEVAPQPLCTRVGLVFSLSLTMLVTRGRIGLLSQPVEGNDDLLCIRSEVDAHELQHLTRWDPGQIHDVSDGAEDLWGTLDVWKTKAPEFLLFAGHGGIVAGAESFGVVLFGPGDVITEDDVLFRLRLPRNKLCVLSACLTGTQSNAGGGDVSGFLRGFIAAGAGLVAITLWSVLSQRIGEVAGRLLNEAHPGRSASDVQLFQAAAVLRQIAAETVARRDESLYEAFPLVLYA